MNFNVHSMNIVILFYILYMNSNKKFENAKNIAEKEITLTLLNNIEDKKKITQKTIATELGIAVGLVNVYVKRCIKKGWLKVTNIPPRRYAYYLTPEGFAKKAQLTADYLKFSFTFFRDSKKICSEMLSECIKRNFKKIALVGFSELTEIALLVCRNSSVNVECILNDENKSNFFDLKICKFNNLPKNIDAVLLTEINNSEKIYKQIKSANKNIEILVPKILGISNKINKGNL